MVWKKEKNKTYKQSYWKKPSKPLHWISVGRGRVKEQEKAFNYFLTPYYSKGHIIKKKKSPIDRKFAVEVSVKQAEKQILEKESEKIKNQSE